MKKRLQLQFVVACLFFTTYQIEAQVPFTQVPSGQMTINGELKTIGNTIVGLNQEYAGLLYTPNISYNGPGSNNTKTFGYIDIDNDDTTFSSSSADLDLSSGCEQIVYAGLYWAASYFVKRDDTDANYVQYYDLPIPDPRPDFRTIKIRPPGTSGYITIPSSQTEVIYDAYPKLSGVWAPMDIPYACYADVTTILQDLDNPNGTYTIANMRASTGFSGYNSNGISGGWLLVVAFEDETYSTKHISTSHGFLTVQPGSQKKEFTYAGFQTAPAPISVKAKYAIAALEGEKPFAGDVFQIVKPDGGVHDIYTAPSNPLNNFFDSSISVNGQNVVARHPSSENTLGFDMDIFDIANPNNIVIGNDQTSATFYTGSSGDAFSVFFNAFQIEVQEPEVVVVEKVVDVNGIDISGDNVQYGDQLFYEFTIENKGTEDVINVNIKDVLPINVDYIENSIITSDPGIIASIDVVNRELNFLIPDHLMVTNGGDHSIRFGVTIVPSCSDLRDACSNKIENNVMYTYTGITSGISTTEESISGKDACFTDIDTFSNTLIQDGVCFSDSKSVTLCGGLVTLSAEIGFSNYEWVNLQNPNIVIGTSQDLVVTQAGDYRVTKSGSADCMDGLETFAVMDSDDSSMKIEITSTNPTYLDGIGSILVMIEKNKGPYTLVFDDETPVRNVSNTYLFDNVAIGKHQIQVYDSSNCTSKTIAVQIEVEDANPLIAYANEILFCEIAEQTYPVIEIVHVEGEKLNVSYSNIGSITWQKLDETNCNVNAKNICQTKDTDCNSWYNVSSEKDYTVTEAGRYRVVITFANKGEDNIKTYYYMVKSNIKNKVTLFPNPIEDVVYVGNQIVNVKVFSTMGKLILESNEDRLDTSNFEAGIYFARVQTKNNQETIIKLMKK